MKLALTILLILACGHALACTTCDHIQGDPSHPIEAWSGEVLSSTQFFAANDQQTLNAHCKGVMPTDAEMRGWLEQNQSSERENAQIHGLNIVGESPENIRALRLLLTARNENFQDDPSLQKTFSSTCQKVDCAVREIFGEVALETLYLQRRYGFNASHRAYPRSVPWKKEELRSAMVGILDFPATHFPMWESRPFTRFLPGQLPSSVYLSATSAEANIRFFDNWAEKTVAARQQTSFHEIAHAIASRTQMDHSPEWRSISDWQMVSQTPVYSEAARRAGKTVSGYASVNALEDFAEAVVAYRYNPQLLQQRSPEKYEFIKNAVFNGVEYLSAQSCQTQNRTSDALIPAAQRGLSQWNPSDEELNRLLEPCMAPLMDASANLENQVLRDHALNRCISEIPRRRGIEFMQAELQGKPWSRFMTPMLEQTQFPIPPQAQQRIRQAQNVLKTVSKNKMIEATLQALTQHAAVPTENSCQLTRNERAYHAFMPLFNDTDGMKSYQYRFKTSRALTQLCLRIARARSPGQQNRPVSRPEVQAQVERLFRTN